MNAKFVTQVGSSAIASFTKDKKHFKYLEPTAQAQLTLEEEAAKWELYSVTEVEVSHDEYGGYALDTQYSTTRLTDFYGEIIVRDGKIVGVIHSYGIIKLDKKVVSQSESWESRAVKYYTRTFTLRRVTKTI